MIKRISFIGGEALTHPNVAEILEGLLKISKIQRIVITTNATIIPSGDFWQIISKYSDRIEILISNYGKDYKKEGLITGIGANMFKLAGSVILFGVVSSFFLVLLKVIIYG